MGAVNNVQSYVGSGFGVVNNVSNAVSLVTNQVQNVYNYVLSKLPSDAQIEQFKNCFESVVNSLPNTTNIDIFIDELYAVIATIPSTQIAQGYMDNIENIIWEIKLVNLKNVSDDVIHLNSSLALFPQKLEVINSTLANYSSILNNLNVPNVTSDILIIDGQFDPPGNLTDQFLANLSHELYTITDNDSNTSTVAIANQILELKNSIIILQSINISSLILKLQNFNHTVISIPSFTDLKYEVLNISSLIDQVTNLTLIYNEINGFNGTFEQVRSILRNVCSPKK